MDDFEYEGPGIDENDVEEFERNQLAIDKSLERGDEELEDYSETDAPVDSGETEDLYPEE